MIAGILPGRVRLGAHRNAHGLMELLVLNCGLDVGVLTPTLFTMLVIMAVAAALMTAPGLNALLGEQAAALMEQTPWLVASRNVHGLL